MPNKNVFKYSEIEFKLSKENKTTKSLLYILPKSELMRISECASIHIHVVACYVIQYQMFCWK